MKQQWITTILLLALLAIPVAAGAATTPNEIPPSAVPALGEAGTLPTIGIDELQAGQKGYGLSVFSGTRPERFEVEVIGVMRNITPDTSYILARLTGHGLEKSGVANGMSGSPVFLDGRLAGAVAFSWPFSHEAIAGITPIELMRKLSTFQGPPSAMPLPPVNLADLQAGRIPKDLLERELARLQPKVALGAQASAQWTTVGFGDRSQALLQRALGSVSSSGKAAPSGDKDLPLGGAVAAVLVDGDFTMAISGTVTDRYGDHVLAFGHPFLGGLGPMRIPMAKAETVMLLSNQYASFKISNVGEVIGAFEQDRQTGIHGRIGAQAAMTPMVVRIASGAGEKPHEYHVRVADLPLFTPMLIGSSVLAGLESAAYTGGQQAIDLTARFRLARYGDLEIRQSFDGDSAATDAAAFTLAFAAYLVQNPLERVQLDRVEVDVRQSTEPRSATLVGANAGRTVVRPGESVDLNLDLVAWRGERFRRSISVDLPEDLPAGRYSLIVGDGSSVDAARLALEPADPVSFPQALELMRSLHSRRDLLVLGVYGGPGLSVAGEVMPRLPASIRSLWSAAASGSATALRSTIAQQVRKEMDMPVDGAVRVDLEVRRREPVSGEDAESAPEGETAKGAAAQTSGGKGGR